MKLLAVDTSTTSCGVALFEDDRLLAEALYTAGSTHSRHLLSIIHQLVERCGWSAADIGGLAVTRGPGTFTGLRIGISTVKGLAAAIGAPVVGVGSLEALAYPCARDDRPVVAVIDARRGEVYHARFRGGPDGPRMETPVAVEAPETAAAAVPAEALLVGSGALLYRRVFRDRCPIVRFADATQHVIRAASVGMLALPRFRRRDVDPIDALAPRYIRPSDAQVHPSGSG